MYGGAVLWRWAGSLQVIRRILPFRQDIAYSFCFTGAETEIHKIKDDSKIDREKNIYRCGPSQIGTVWHILDPPTFSLPTTFNEFFKIYVIAFEDPYWYPQ